jgi:precorrin-2 dehydrogenase/sirohydrochlorin ferrochelatase
MPGKINLELRAFAPRDLDGKFLVVVATASNSLNEFVYRKAERRGVLCNVVDVPEYCDFFYPGVVRCGDLQIAISTAGQSASLAQKIRQQLERSSERNKTDWIAQCPNFCTLFRLGFLQPWSHRGIGTVAAVAGEEYH